MQRCKLNISLALVTTIGLAMACSDEDVVGAGAETGGAADEVGTDGQDDNDETDSQDGAGDGDGDSNDGNSGDGDGDGDSGDGDGDSGDGDGDSGDGDGDSGDGDGDSGDGDGDSGDGDGDADTDTDTDTSGGVCGDGVVDPGEECDDGADMGEGFACLADCTSNVCGDGTLGPTEACDDGNKIKGDGCAANCTLEGLDADVILCNDMLLFACGDTLDNDMDGLTDLDDPECTSPCDDDESSFKTSLPGQNNDCKSDCYFDSNSGGGDDGCDWNLQCDPMNPGAQVGCGYDEDFQMCDVEQSSSCMDACVPLLPNGCDCFGCCEFEGQFVYLDGSADCTLNTLLGLDDGTCQSCTPNDACPNPCNPENCEVCFGQDPEDLPPECLEPECPDGVTSCQDESDCMPGEFCQTGCCVPS